MEELLKDLVSARDAQQYEAIKLEQATMVFRTAEHKANKIQHELTMLMAAARASDAKTDV